ncbi:hypothetical protein OY671_012145, partial [Metschnikowia pulcherrima]
GVSAGARIASRGVAALSEADRTSVVEILEPGQDEPSRSDARADVWSDSQFAMSRDGGSFAAFRKRFGGM